MAVALKSAYPTIPVGDIQRAVEWYGEHFGFKVGTEAGPFVELQNEAGVRIILLQNDHNLHSHFVYPDGAPQSSYGFIVDDAEAVYKYLQEKGVRVGEFFDYQGKSFSFYDLDGNFIEIWSLPQSE